MIHFYKRYYNCHKVLECVVLLMKRYLNHYLYSGIKDDNEMSRFLSIEKDVLLTILPLLPGLKAFISNSFKL